MITALCVGLVLPGCGDDDPEPAAPAPDTSAIADLLTPDPGPSVDDPGPTPEDSTALDVATDADATDADPGPDTEVADAAPPPADGQDGDAADVIVDDTPDVPEVEEDTGPPPPPFWEDLPEGYEQAHFEDLEVDLDGKTGDIDLIVPEGTLSLTVMLTGAPKDVWMRITKLVVPPGFPIVKSQGTVFCVTCENRVQAAQIVSTALAPNSPSVKFKTQGGKYKLGMWQFTVTPLGGSILVTEWSGTTMNARVLFKMYDGLPTAGTIDLNLFFTGSGEVTAEAAPENPRIVEMLTDLQAVYDQVGLTIGEVRYFDAPEGAPQTIETTIEVDSDLGQLFQTSLDAPPGINVYFVDEILKTEIEDQTTGIVLGIAGGIPGPPWLHNGSPHSGVALSWFDTAGENDKLGEVLAHEIGHYLGLYHTTEKDGMSFDPIEDTESDVADNLMFWAFGGGFGLTPGQRFVMLRHPSVWLAPPTETDP